MLRSLSGSVLVLAGAAFVQAQEKPARTALPDAAVEIPLQIVSGQPAFEVRIDGQGPFLFLFDTGAAGCGRISAELSQRLKLPEVDEVEASDPSGRNSRMAKRVRAAQVQVGEADFRDLLLLRRGPQDPDDRGPGKIQGIVGIGLFADALVALDYPGRKLSVSRGELPPADGREVFDFTNEHGIPSIALSIDGVEVRGDVDSGSMGMLTVPADLAGKLALAGAPVVVGRGRTSFNEFEIKESRLKGDLRLGRHVFESPTIAFSDLFPHANLGSAFLRHFVVTIDQKNKRIRFARQGSAPIRAEPRYRVGVGFEPQQGTWLVREVAPGGAGAAAGLKAGDRIVRVNGRPAAEVEDEELRVLCSRPEPVRLTVERGGTSLDIEVTPRPAQ